MSVCVMQLRRRAEVKTHDVMNYYVARVNKDSSSVVKNLMKLTPRGVKNTIVAVNYKDALMDAIYEVAAAAA